LLPLPHWSISATGMCSCID